MTLSTLAPVEYERGASAALVRGVAEYFAAHSLKIGGFNAAIESDIPIGSGVSSSAAFEVLIGRIFNALYNNGSAEPMTIALAAQYAENAHFGKPCGLMDQAACALGGVQFIDFFDNAAPNASALEWPFTNEFAIYIINTGSSHADMADAYTQITADMKSVSDILGVDRLGHADEAEFMRRLGEIRRAAGDRATMRALHFSAKRPRERYGCGNTLGGCGGVCAHNAAKRGFERIPFAEHIHTRSAGQELSHRHSARAAVS